MANMRAGSRFSFCKEAENENLIEAGDGMEKYEKLNVCIRYENGSVTCVCLQSNKRCNRACEKERVSRYKFYGWKDTFYQDRYGKSRI